MTVSTDTLEHQLPKAKQTASLRGPILYTVIGLFVLVVFGFMAAGDVTSPLSFSTRSDLVQIPVVTFPTRLSGITLGILTLLIAAYSFVQFNKNKKIPLWLVGVFGFLAISAFLIWAFGGVGLPLQVAELLRGSLFLATPLVFGGMAGVICERSGVINIAIEGQFLAGAFLAGVVASMTGMAYLGLVAAPIAGALVGLLLAVFSLKYLVDQIVVGVVINVLIVGLTSYLFSTILSDNAATLNRSMPLPRIDIPFLSEIPILGPLLFRQTILVYAMFIFVIVLQFMLFRSRWGLRLRAVGEHPKAADTVGIKVNRTRYRNVVFGGAIAGFGGAFFTIASGLAFSKETTAGMGYIALAAMIIGRWQPTGVLLAALLFGFSRQLSISFGDASPIPSNLMLMVPYVITVIVVAGFVGRVRGPAAAGDPYVK